MADLINLHFWAASGDLSTIKKSAKIGHFYSRLRDSIGSTPLHSAAQGGHLDVVKFFIKVDPECILVRNQFGYTPLYYAILNGHLSIVKYLVTEAKADITVEVARDLLPLSLAVQYGHCEIVKFLVEPCGADINVKSLYGWTPLHFAALYRHLAIARVMIETKKADVNAREGDGFTPLHIAAQNGAFDIVKLLVDEGQADVHAETYANSRTAQYYATLNKHTDIEKYLDEKASSTCNFIFDKSVGFLRKSLATVTIEVENMSKKLEAAKLVQQQLKTLQSSEEYLTPREMRDLSKKVDQKEMKVKAAEDIQRQIDALKVKADYIPPIILEKMTLEVYNGSKKLRESVVVHTEIHNLQNDPDFLSDTQMKNIHENLEKAKIILDLPSTSTIFKKGSAEEADVKSMMEKQERAKKELECCICIEIPQTGTNVFSCQSHHLLCCECFKKQMNECCPVCKQDFTKVTPTRNLLAEKIIANLD